MTATAARPVVGATVTVKVGGSPVSESLTGYLQEFTFEDSVQVPDVLELRYADPNGAFPQGTPFEIGKEVGVTLRAPGIESADYAGEITALIGRWHEGVYTFTVRAMDKMHRLHRGRWTKTYEEVKASDVFGQICSEEGLTRGTCDDTSVTYPHLSIVNESHYSFLRRLALDSNRVLSFSDGKVHFAKRKDPEPVLSLSPQSGLLDLEIVITAADLTQEVAARGWDVKTKKMVEHTMSVKATGIEVAKSKVASLSNKLQTSKATTVIASSNLEDTAQATAAAESAAEMLGGGYAELHGTSVGSPKLRAGASIELIEAAEAFLGKYVISSTRHILNPHEGYVTEFSVSGGQDRSMLGMAGGSSDRSLIRGVAPAIVTDTKDPQNQGRVRVAFPWTGAEHNSGWARPVLLGAGNDRGLTFLPSVDDEVLVAFAHGDASHPFVLGGLHNGLDKLPDHGGDAHFKDGKVQLRGIYTDRQQVAFVDNDGKESITMGMRDKSYVVSIDKGQTTIKVTSDGKVEIVAKDKVTITSKSDVTISATSKISFEAKGAVSIKGMGVEIVDQAGASLKLQGTAALKGATVAIN